MNIFKKLFAKKPKSGCSLFFDFDFGKVRDKEKYIVSVLKVIEECDEMRSLKSDNTFYLEFGDPSAIHIIYFGYCDLHILMEPENDGWTASCVYVNNTESNSKAFEKLRFLFQFQNPLANEKPIIFDDDDPIVWSEYAKVYACD